MWIYQGGTHVKDTASKADQDRDMIRVTCPATLHLQVKAACPEQAGVDTDILKGGG